MCANFFCLMETVYLNMPIITFDYEWNLVFSVFSHSSIFFFVCKSENFNISLAEILGNVTTCRSKQISQKLIYFFLYFFIVSFGYFARRKWYSIYLLFGLRNLGCLRLSKNAFSCSKMENLLPTDEKKRLREKKFGSSTMTNLKKFIVNLPGIVRRTRAIFASQ